MTDDRDLRPDHEMEGRVSTWLTETDLTPDEANVGLRRLLDDFPVTPQARRRFLGRWLDRDEGVGRHAADHDPPPNTNRRNRLMLSATGIAAALAILAISVNVIQDDPVIAPGAEAPTHVVAADGSGDFTTIQAAVEAAADGDSIAVRPGRYEGPVIVDKDLTISGDGPREDIVIVAPAGEANLTDWIDDEDLPHAVLVDGADATITDVTVEVALNTTGIGSMDASPLIERVTLVRVGPEVPDGDWYNSYQSLWFNDVGEPVVRDSEWDAHAGVRGAAALFEGNTVTADGISVDGPGPTTIRGNTFIDGGWVNASGAELAVLDNEFAGGNVTVDSQSVVEVRGNVFRDYRPDLSMGDAAITAYGSQATIEANTIAAALRGIQLNGGATGSIVSNAIDAQQISIQLDDGMGIVVEDNVITGEGQGLMIGRGSDATVSGNDIDVDARGIAISAGSSPTVTGNDVCGGFDGIWVADGAEPVLEDNTVC